MELPEVVTYVDGPVAEQRQVLTAEEIERMHVCDLPEVLQSCGVQMLSYGPYGLEQKPSIRGSTDETVRVVIDGICVNNAQYGSFDFSSISVADIERLEIVRGGFTEGVSDEGAVGGVIYISTKKQSLGHHFTSDSSIKSYFNSYLPFDTFSQQFGYSGQLSDNDFLKLNLKGVFANNRFLFLNYQNRLKERLNSEVVDGTSNVSYSHFFDGGNCLTVSDLFYAGNKNCPGTETSTTVGVQKDIDNNVTVSLINPELGGIVRLENNFAWLCNNRFYSEPGSAESKHYVNTFKYAGYADFYALKNIRQNAGLTFDITNLDSTNSGKHTHFSGTFKETTKIQFSRIFSMSVPFAFKFDNKNTAVIPKLGFKAAFGYFDIMLDGYRMIQFPILQDLYWEGAGFHGNPDLKPEQGWGAELTFDVHRFIVPFSVCFYTNYYESKIKWVGNTTQNVASAFYFGIDFNSQKSFFNDRLILRGNVEYLYTELLDKNNKYEYGKRIMWTPDFTASLVVIGKLPFVNCVLECNYIGKRYTDNMNLFSLNPYFLMNLSAEYTCFEHVTPYLRFENLLNQDYEAVENYPMPGISITMGAKLSF